MTELSLIITAREEVYLQKTIDSALAAIEADTELIVVCDGYVPEPPINRNDRVILLYHPVARGQRQSINEAAKIARGEFIAKFDAHCAFGQGFDRILLEPYRNGELTEADTTVPRMFNLATDTWTPKLHKRTDYMYIGMGEGRELRAEYYGSRQPDSSKELDETMCCMGPMWLLSKDRFWKQGGCDEGHGSWGQQGVEVALKAWLSGGRLMVNKRTWVAHWFRGGGGPGFPYPISGREVDAARHYSRNLWLKNAWPGQVRPLEWLVKKFNPPSWENYEFEETELPQPVPSGLDEREYYRCVAARDHFPKWMGTTLVKYPNDVLLYQEIIYNNRPDFIVETGTYRGGSALFFAHMMDIVGNGHVITVDLHDHNPPQHPRITHIVGRATGDDTLAKVRSMIPEDAKVMVVLDSDHRRVHVKRELHRYSPFVTQGQYLVVEDSNWGVVGKPGGPDEAIAWFLPTHPDFEVVPLENRFIFSLNRGGWLRRK